MPADLVAWAQVVDVSRLPAACASQIGEYLRTYRRVPLAARREVGFRLLAVVESHVSPPPPFAATPLDVLATVLAAHRRQFGG